MQDVDLWGVLKLVGLLFLGLVALEAVALLIITAFTRLIRGTGETGAEEGGEGDDGAGWLGRYKSLVAYVWVAPQAVVMVLSIFIGPVRRHLLLWVLASAMLSGLIAAAVALVCVVSSGVRRVLIPAPVAGWRGEVIRFAILQVILPAAALLVYVLYSLQ